MQLRKLNKKKNKIKAIIYGSYGTRKSSMASDFALMKNENGEDFKVLYIDAETESLSGFNTDRLEAKGVNMNNVLLLEPSSMEELMEVLKKIEEKEPFYELDEDGEETDVEIKDGYGNVFYPDAIVVDSVSALVQDIKSVYREISKVRAKVRNEDKDVSSSKKFVAQQTADLELSDYGKIKGMGEKFVSQLIRKIDCHTAIIVRGKDEKKSKKVNGVIQMIDTGREIMDTWDFLKYDGNIVIHLKKEEDEFGKTTKIYGLIDSKDRTGTFAQGDIIENPSMTLWQCIVDKNKNRAENKSYQKRLSPEDKVKETIKTGIKKVKEEKVTVEERIIAIKTSFAKLGPEQKKALASQLKKNNILPKDFIEGKCPEKDLIIGCRIIQSLED